MLMWKRWKKGLWGAVAGLMALGAGVASAEIVLIRGVNVIETLSAAGNYGDCMAGLNKQLSEYISGCPGNWVTLSCDGTYNSKDAGQRKFESAQLALALGYRASVYVDNTKKHNGFCYAQRMEIYK